MTKTPKQRLARCALLLVAPVWLSGCQGGNSDPGGVDTLPSVGTAPVTSNRSPVPVADTKVADGTALLIAVLENDFDPDNNPLVLTAVGSPAHGTVRIDDAGTPNDGSDDVLIYVPETGYTGADEFDYTVTDSEGARAIGTVKIMAMPAAADKIVTTTASTPVTIEVLDLAGFEIAGVSVPAFGSISIDARGTPADASDDRLVYTPAAGYAGTDAFLYTITGPGGSDTAGVTIEVTASATAPPVNNVSGQILKGPIRDAVVRLYELGPDGSRVGVPVAAVTTDPLGRWQASAPMPRTDLLVVASGGRYNDETNTTGTQRIVELTAADEIIAVMPADEDIVVSSVYSYSLYLRARHAAGGADFMPVYADVRQQATAAWNLDLTTTPATDPSAPDPRSPMDARRHALALGGAANALATVVSRLGLNRPDGATIRALARDLSNCGLDGRDAAGIIQIAVRGVQRPIADNIDLNREILRFRNNRSDQYFATDLPAWNAPLCVSSDPPTDDRAPVVTVDAQRTGATSPALSGRIDDPVAAVDITLNGVRYPAINLGTTWVLPAGQIAPVLADGVYDVRVTATDRAGNLGIDNTANDLVIDTALPAVTIDPTVSASGVPVLRGSVSDATAVVTVSINGNAYVTTVTNSEWVVAPGNIPTLSDGNYDVTVTAEAGGRTAVVIRSDAVIVGPNTPPTFTLSGDLTLNEDFIGARVVNVMPDPVPAAEADQVVRYRLQPSSVDFADVTISATTGRVIIVAKEDAFGTQSFVITADDGQASANVATGSFSLTINPINDAPEFTLSGDILESQDFIGERRVTVASTPPPDDETEQSISYALSPASVGFADVSFSSVDGTVSINSIAGGIGSQVFTVSATDNEGASSAQIFSLTVGPVSVGNDAPVIVGQGALVTSEENPITVLLAQLLVSDPDSNYPDDFTLSLQPGANYVVAGDTVTPITDFSGTLSVPVTVNDGTSTSAQFSLTVDVQPINDPPAFSLDGDVVEVENFSGTRVVALTPAPVPADETGQTVSYRLEPASVSFANVTINPATGAVTIAALPDASGSQRFTVIADDGQALNNAASQNFHLTVIPGVDNVAPVITGQAAMATPEDTALAVSLAQLVVSDPDSVFPADFSLTVQPGANYTVVGTTLILAANFNGTLTVPVTVSDGIDTSVPFDLSVSVLAVNDVPAFGLSGDVVAAQDFSGNRVVTVTPAPVPADEAAQPLSYSLDPGSVAFANVSVDPAAGTVTISAVPNAAGSQMFTLTADDGQPSNNTASQTFTLTVVNSNTVPTTSGIADIATIDSGVAEVIDLFAAFDDTEDADADLAFAVTGNTDPTLFDALDIDPVAGTLSLDFVEGVSGTSTLTITATDTGGATVATDVSVSLTPEADLRIATLSVSDPKPGVGSTVSFTLVLQNQGPSAATGVYVDVPLPAGYVYVGANNPGEYDAVTGQWYRSRLSGTSTLVLMAEVQAFGPYDVVAEVATMNEVDPDSTPGNAVPGEDDYATVTTAPRPVTDVTLSIIVDDPIPAPDDTFTLTVTVENNGPRNANGIRVSLPPLPGELVYEGASPSQGIFNQSTGLWRNVTVPWSGDPAAPLSATLTVTARVQASVPTSTVLTVDAQIIESNQADPDGIEQDTAAILVTAEGTLHEWVGGAGPDPTDWHNPSNWNTGTVPVAGDDATIPLTANDPVLNADVIGLAFLDIETGAAVYANGNTISSRGQLRADDGPILGPGEVRLEWGTMRGSVPNLTIDVLSPAGEVEVDDDVVVAGDLVIRSGRLDIARNSVWVGGNLTATGAGLLVQRVGSSQIRVAGDVLFDGGNYATKVSGKFPLRDGVLFVGGDFTQTGDPHSFAAEDDHLVVFNGSGPQSIFMQDPDSSNPGDDLGAATGSRFANLRVDKDYAIHGALTLLSDVAVLKTLEQPEGGIPKLRAAALSGHALSVGGLDIDTPPYPLTDSIVFDNVPLRYLEGDSHHHFEGAVFMNMDRTVAQLTVARDGLENAGRLIDVRFETLPDFAAGGRYIVVDNINSDPTKNITLDVRQSLPAYGLPMTETVGNATILWGAPGGDSDRDGILDEDEYSAGTNPVFSDSDHDGLDDPDELLAGTQPLVTDSDGDGIGDGAETKAGGNPLVAAAPGTVLYVRPAPFGDDTNSGFGGWTDALATNAAVEAALVGGIAPDQPTYVLYEAGTFLPLVIDRIDNVALIGSLGPGSAVPNDPPTTVFDAGTTPDVAVVEITRSDNVRLQSLTLRGANNNGSGEGGGLYVDDRSNVVVHDAIIEDNVAADWGGGAFVDDGGWLSLLDTSIRNNVASSTGGGGIAALGGLTLLRSTLAYNRFDGGGNNTGGGAVYLEPGSHPVEVRDSQFLSNSSATNGGAILIPGVFAPITIKNNLLFGNVAQGDRGGGIAGDKLDRGFPTLIESNTIVFNSALADTSGAGGVHVDRADDLRLLDNVLWFNTDPDAIDEVQDQFVDDGASAVLEFNTIEDFGAGDTAGNDDDNPRFERGFYLRPDSEADDNGSRTASDAGLDAPYTTAIDGTGDTLVLDQGYHYTTPADGEAYAVVLAGEIADCATDTLTLRFVLPGVGGDLGAGHIIAVRHDGGDTGGGVITTLAPLEPYNWSNSVLAVDEGNGVYRLDVVGVSHGAGETTVINIRVDNDLVFDLTSTDLSVLFAGSGC